MTYMSMDNTLKSITTNIIVYQKKRNPNSNSKPNIRQISGSVKVRFRYEIFNASGVDGEFWIPYLNRAIARAYSD